MKRAVVAVVVAGVALALVLGMAAGLDTRAVVILVALVATGALAIVVASRSDSGAIAPARCPECDGLLSPNAPYCKHCGAALS